MAGIDPDHTPAQLINEPELPDAATRAALGPIEHLIGTWKNVPLPGTSRGGPDAPYSYNVMPLPQDNPASPAGYILKNFSYFEEISFSPIAGTAPNRSGSGTQVAHTLFYEQRVYFAEGPAQNSLVHAENGSWLYLTSKDQLLGPYGDGQGDMTGNESFGSPPPPAPAPVIKQMSVPHGNSILAAGSFDQGSGMPDIPTGNSTLPSGVDTAAYLQQSVGNPQPDLTQHPNQVLQQAVAALNPQHWISLSVSSNEAQHNISNIPFEQTYADVTEYWTTIWLLETGAATPGASPYSHLLYTQTMLMDMQIHGQKISFPHVTANVLTRTA